MGAGLDVQVGVPEPKSYRAYYEAPERRAGRPELAQRRKTLWDTLLAGWVRNGAKEGPWDFQGFV